VSRDTGRLVNWARYTVAVAAAFAVVVVFAVAVAFVIVVNYICLTY